MQDFIKQNWFKLGILFILIIVISSGFYWFQMRPIRARQDCIKKYPSAFSNGGGLIATSEKAGYERCLKGYGLEK